ncbi:tRNA pseudouridine synthase A isoform X2 [Macrobrachium rosenbergii]|uniref:tRNA pseudouridine synthase A isoform X2 n=1 Tax=Macrobrachium rosenbergii TaxID=79674 RepID=UPI0034D47B7D
MRRFLLYISYCGTRGVQRQPNEELRKLPRSVQGLLEEGLLSLYPANTPHLYFSSRTDKGVHALSNTAHVDLCRKTEGLFYDPDVITGRLNKYLSHEGHDIRVHKTLAVPSGFHARYHAVRRSYLYRIAVLKPDIIVDKNWKCHAFLPSVEVNRIHIVRSHFDIEKFVSGCHLLQGSHNFATFMSAPSKTTYPIDPNRCLDSITVEEGRPFLDPGYEQLYERLQLWDVKLSAKAFLHNQVRRIVGAAVGVAQGKISLDCIQAMLDNPAPQNWNTRVSPVPACGLYLLQVKYPSEVFEESFHQGNIQEKSTL